MSFVEIIIGSGTTIAAAVVGVWGLSVANKHQKGTREDRLIDQLQEQLREVEKSQKEMRAEHTAESKAFKERLTQVERRDQTYIPYIMLLHRHIEMNLGPPAPALPQLIDDFLQERR